MDNKKIGLAIVYDYPNYGSRVQAVATQIVLQKMGYEPIAINTKGVDGEIAKRKYRYFAANIFDSTIVKEKAQMIAKKLRQKLSSSFREKMDMRQKAFKDFGKKHMLETPAYATWEEMTEAARDFGAVLVGSDQLWLPSNVCADYYTLNWVPDEVKKICYSTSFGISKIPPKYREKYSQYLNRINFLSARETSGQQIIKDITGRDAQLVCDPAMLLDADEWDKIATPGRLYDEPYVFCYFLGDNPEQREFARKLADKHGCKVVSFLHLDQYIASDEGYADYTPYDASPADFISLIKNARFVCTDSFHCTVFSILYHKDFFTFRRFNKKASLSTNTRIYSLLDRLGLSDRLFNGDENPEEDWTIRNYDEIEKSVQDFRNDSLKYLKEALEA